MDNGIPANDTLPLFELVTWSVQQQARFNGMTELGQIRIYGAKLPRIPLSEPAGMRLSPKRISQTQMIVKPDHTKTDSYNVVEVELRGVPVSSNSNNPVETGLHVT